jgi:hypothetical protein
MEYVDYFPEEIDTNAIQISYNTKRVAIALELKRFKQVVEFQAVLLKYPSDALEAMFHLVQKFLKNELNNSDLGRRAGIISMIDFFTYSNYVNSEKWWDTLYSTHLMNSILEEIIALVI